MPVLHRSTGSDKPAACTAQAVAPTALRVEYIASAAVRAGERAAEPAEHIARAEEPVGVQVEVLAVVLAGCIARAAEPVAVPAERAAAKAAVRAVRTAWAVTRDPGQAEVPVPAPGQTGRPAAPGQGPTERKESRQGPPVSFFSAAV